MAPDVLPSGTEESPMSRRLLPLVLLACLFATAAFAADDPMVGAWKLNPQKSKLVDEMKVASLGGNKYSFNFGGPQSETIVADGTDQPGLGGTTLAVTPGQADWTVVRKKDGRVQLRAIWTLSADGKQLHDDYTEFAGDGKSMHVDYVYDRRAPGQGFAGDWVSTSQQIDTEYILEMRAYEGGGLTMLIPSEGVEKNLVFDNKDYPNAGSERVTSSRRVNDRTIEVTDKRNGDVVSTQEISISEDGKTLTLTIRVPSRTDPNVLVFDRN